MIDAFLALPFAVLSHGLFSDAWLALVAGLLVGSFLNVCIYRWPLDLSVVRPRSHCPACEAAIAWYDNVPLLSFAILRGRCRHCQARISPRYPVVELLTGAMFFAMVYRYGLTPIAGKLCIFAAMLVVLLFTDLEERILPDEITVWGAVLGLGLAIVAPTPDTVTNFVFWVVGLGSIGWLVHLGSAAFAAALPAGMIWFAGWLYQKVRHKEGLGLGDIKMVALLGCYLGLNAGIFTLVLGSGLGALIGLAYIKITHQEAATYELPFGTFLAAAGLIVLVFLPKLEAW